MNISTLSTPAQVQLKATHDEFEALLFNSSNNVVWMSVFDRDKSAQAIEKVKREYPASDNNKTYFTYNGQRCASHINCTLDVPCNCIKIDGGKQCAGFARYVFAEVKGRIYTKCRNSGISITGFGDQLSVKTESDDNIFSGEDLTAQTAKKYLLGLSIGAYVRVEEICDREYPYHSFAVLETSDTGITIYEANTDGHCLVKITSYTWSEFAEKYRLLFYVD